MATRKAAVPDKLNDFVKKSARNESRLRMISNALGFPASTELNPQALRQKLESYIFEYEKNQDTWKKLQELASTTLG